jgi:hypothetical protein
LAKAIFGLVALALLVLVLAGCGSSSPAAPSAEAAFCQSVTTLGIATNQLAQVNGSTTSGQAKSDFQGVTEALADVKTAAVNVHTARVNDLETAINNLQQTITTLPNSATLSEAATSIQTQVTAVQSARGQLGTQVSRGTPTATP